MVLRMSPTTGHPCSGVMALTDRVAAPDPPRSGKGSMEQRVHGPAEQYWSTRADVAAVEAVLTATHELLWISSPADAQAAAVRLVAELGGEVVTPDAAGGDALPVDVSFGEGGTLLPSAPAASVAHRQLVRHLPGFVRDAHRAVELAARTQRLAEEAEIDPLTGLATRRVVGRALGRLRSDDLVIMVDLDHFKQLNDTLGHGEGDRVLRSFGRAIGGCIRARDLAGRYGGEEFVIILTGSKDSDAAEVFLRRLRTLWEANRPHPVTFSAGIARVGSDPSQALPAADEAMYEAKRSGRDRWVWSRAPAAD